MIDYCTILVHEGERELLAMQLRSLRHYSGDEFNFKVSVRPEDTDSIEFCKQLGLEVLLHPTYTQMLAHPGLRQAGFDCANRMHELMKSCTSDWVILTHSDIIYTGKIDMALMTDEYGLLGVWAHGCTAINRKVYNGCHYLFWPMGGILARLVCRPSKEWDGTVKLVGNHEQEEEFLSVSGVDVGELLKLEMQGYGFKFDPSGFSGRYRHLGGASFHGLTPKETDIIEDIIARKAVFIEEFKEFK